MTNPNLLRNEVENALRVLEGNDFDVKALWKEWSQRLESWDRGVPDSDDFRYSLPVEAPRMVDHLKDGENAVLSCNVLWAGYSYTLTPGQRAWLRDNYDLTPTETVTAKWVENWPSTVHPRSMCLVSDLHIPSNRKHVLTSAVIRNVGRFFRESEERDAAERKEKVFGIAPASLEIGRLFTLESEERWAVEDLTGVKVQSKVEVVARDATRVTIVCHRTGNQARVEKAAFFATRDEYAKLYATKKRTKSAFGPTPAIDDILKSMGVPLA